MAVQYVKGNSLLGTLGGLATIAGAFIPGAGFLSGLGTALGTADRMMNGGGGASGNGESSGSVLDIMRQMLGMDNDNPGRGSLVNPNNVKKTAPIMQWPSMVSNNDNQLLNPLGIYNYQNGWPNYFKM